jgi:hypothetical protein
MQCHTEEISPGGKQIDAICAHKLDTKILRLEEVLEGCYNAY